MEVPRPTWEDAVVLVPSQPSLHCHCDRVGSTPTPDLPDERLDRGRGYGIRFLKASDCKGIATPAVIPLPAPCPRWQARRRDPFIERRWRPDRTATDTCIRLHDISTGMRRSASLGHRFRRDQQPTTRRRRAAGPTRPELTVSRLLEHDAKLLLAEAGITVPRGRVVTSAAAAAATSAEMPGDVVIKALVPANRRAKSGLIAVANGSRAEAYAAELLARTYAEAPVEQLLVEEKVAIEQELFFSIVLDRTRAKVVALASLEGGVEIEETSAANAGLVATIAFDPLREALPHTFRCLWSGLGLSGPALPAVVDVCVRATRVFFECEATILELNPLALVRSPDGREPHVVAVGAVMALDDNALARHPELAGAGAARQGVAAADGARARGDGGRRLRALPRHGTVHRARRRHRIARRRRRRKPRLLRRRPAGRRSTGVLHGDRRQPVGREGAAAHPRRPLVPERFAACSSATTSPTTRRSTSSPPAWLEALAELGRRHPPIPRRSRGRWARTTRWAGTSSARPASNTSERRSRWTRPPA